LISDRCLSFILVYDYCIYYIDSKSDWSSGENTRLQIPNGSLLSPKLNLRSLSSSTDSTRQADVSPSPHVSILSAIASPRAKLDVSTARRSSFDVALSPVQDSASSDGIKLANIMQQDYERRLADANAYTQRIQNECDEAKREVARMKDRLANMGQLLERERHTVRGQQIQLQATQHNPHRTPPPLHVPHTPLSPTTLRSPMSARGALSSPTSARSFRPDEFQDRISALGIATTPSRDAMLSAWLNPQQTHSSTAPVAPAASIAELRDAMESLMFELDVDKLWFQVGQCARALGRCQRVALYLVDGTTYIHSAFSCVDLIFYIFQKRSESWSRSTCLAACKTERFVCLWERKFRMVWLARVLCWVSR
jgi:hypothetical protein